MDPEIQKRVREAALRLGIDLHQRNGGRTLAFVLSNRGVLHPFHSRVLLGAQEHCALRGWDMLFLSYDYPANVPWKQLHFPQIFHRREIVRAVILAGTNSQNLFDLLTHKGIPFVVLGNNVIGGRGDDKYDAVFSDDIQGGREMTRYLQALGHRDIYFVGNSRHPWAARCYEGYRQAMEEHGLPARPKGIESEDDKEVGYLAAKSIFARGDPASAILAATDATARGVYKAVKDCGLRIPDDVSVAGCNDTDGALLDPPLTTIREFPEQLGKQMVELVLNRIAHPELPRHEVTIPTELAKRESCRPLAPASEATSERGPQGALRDHILPNAR